MARRRLLDLNASLSRSELRAIKPQCSDPNYGERMVAWMKKLWDGVPSDKKRLAKLKAIARDPKKRAQYEAKWGREGFPPAIEDDIRRMEDAVVCKLNRRNWTAERWDREKAMHLEIEADLALVQRFKIRKQRKFLRDYQVKQQQKAEREQRSIERQDLKVQREIRKAMKVKHEEQVTAAMQNGKETTREIAKATGLETKQVRQALKRLEKVDKAYQLSAQHWAIEKPSRRRLSDMQ